MNSGLINYELKNIVRERAHFCCEYCLSQKAFSPVIFSIEHIIPKAKGGESKQDNLALAWQACNNHKYIFTSARDPATGQSTDLYNPRQHEWDDHFQWNADFSLIVGISSVGRATVAKLQLNRRSVVNLRKVLFSIGKHPVD